MNWCKMDCIVTRLLRRNLLRTVVAIAVSTLIIRVAVYLESSSNTSVLSKHSKHVRDGMTLGSRKSDHSTRASTQVMSSVSKRPRQTLRLSGAMTDIRTTPASTRRPTTRLGQRTTTLEGFINRPGTKPSPKQIHNSSLPTCPERITGLGLFDLKLQPPSSVKKIEQKNKNVFNGGRWRPSNCTSRHRVAILVPYRNRDSQLRIFLQNIHRFLQTQFIDYGIYIIEQANGTLFNRAKLFNIGYKESMKDYDWQCFVFHDVDLIPENTRNIYSCPRQPRHMSVAIDTFGYKLYYEGQFGGVAAMTAKQFEKVNGYSNAFFGWGGEDDDMAFRITAAKMKRIRYPPTVARYTMVAHKKDTPDNPNGLHMLNYAGGRNRIDGLNNLVYTLQSKKMLPLYTNISVSFENDRARYLKQIISKRLKRVLWEPNHTVQTPTYDTIDW